MSIAADRRANKTSRRPIIRFGVVSSAGVKVSGVVSPAPYYHFIPSPNSGVRVSTVRRASEARGCPRICCRIVFSTGIGITAVSSTPDDHFTAAPDGHVTASSSRRISGASGYPTVCAWAVSAAGVQVVGQISPPHTIISLPLHTVLCDSLALGAPMVVVAVQVSVPGLYLPPVLRTLELLSSPPQIIISFPLHTAV